MASSALFQPYRALGFVCDSVPFHLKKLGSNPAQHFITVAIGKAWQVYNCDKLRLCLIGPHRDRKVRALASMNEYTFTAHGAEIIVWKRASEVRRLRGHVASVYLLLVFGDYLLSISKDQVLHIWKWNDTASTTGYSCTKLAFPADESGATITTIMHPHTYLNKIVLGFSDGRMELWNVKTHKRIYTYTRAALGLDAGQPSSVACIIQSPSVDVVAVGLSSGHIVVHNLKADETIITFNQARQSGVTALSFRTDGPPYLVSGCTGGHMHVWDLQKRALVNTIRNTHQGGVCSAAFLPGEPLIVTSGQDNSLKMWIFDQQDGTPRQLKSREGHSHPPNKVRFYGDGSYLLSSGEDRALRSFSILRDQQSRELSQGSLLKQSKLRGVQVDLLRLGRVLDFAASTSKERRWANILSCHKDDHSAHTWSFEAKRLSKHKLVNPDFPAAHVTAVAVSACGNFGLVGTADGRVDKYNLQSGTLRGSYKVGKNKSSRAHTGQITGIAVDGLNRLVMTTSLDLSLKFWDFLKGDLIETISTEAPISQLLFHPASDLAALATDDLKVYVYDVHTHKLVRKFGGGAEGPQNRISDMAFSPDGRWLVTSSMDSGVRVYDVPSGRMVDWFVFGSPVSSLAFSPNSEFLATTHADNLGVFLWVNKSYFTNVYASSAPTAPREMDLPLPASFDDEQLRGPLAGHAKRKQPDTGDAEEAAIEKANQDTGEEDEENDRFGPVPIAPRLVTMSALPKSRWHDLTHLELIKERNKPKEGPKAPALAPFFLSTTQGLEPKLDTSHFEEEQAKGQDASKLLKNQPLHDASSALAALLDQFAAGTPDDGAMVAAKEEEAVTEDPVAAHLRSLGPAALDADISALGMDLLREELELGQALDYVLRAIEGKRNFELMQAVLNRILKLHGDTLTKYPELLSKKTAALRRVQESAWRRLERKLQHTHCLLAHFSESQM
jgi:U3 small nucleolar RNA-associated protein 21